MIGQNNRGVAINVETAALTLEDDKEASWKNFDAADNYNDSATELATTEDRAVSPEQSDQAEGTMNEGAVDDLRRGSANDELDEDKGEEPICANEEEVGEARGDAKEDDVAEEENAASEGGTESTDVVWQAGDTFSSLITFFDATALDTLKPTHPGGFKLPTEITEMILDHIFDMKTHNACLKVSRDFRRICLKRPVLVDGVRLLQPLSEMNSKEKAERQLRFLARKATGETFEILVKTWSFRQYDDNYYIIAGNKWNRKSFPPGAEITVQNLRMPAPFDSDEEKGVDDDDFLWSYEDRPKPEDNPWDKAKRRYDIITRRDVKVLKEYWQRVTAIMFRDLVRGFGQSVLQEDTDWLNDWLLPANTKQLVIHSDEYYHKGWHRYLFLRMKRASRYWHDLWDQLIGEIKDLLPQQDKSMYLEKRKVKPLFGAENPDVILIVGLEVRLFKWHTGDKTLMETNPGKVYSVMNEQDRKFIEAVLNSAVDKLRAAEKKLVPSFSDDGDSHSDSDDDEDDEDDDDDDDDE
ncbi:MAG: hypothetical protein L6R41_000601 [Letrouitia leprolyta]|nr:MAG: hypothetical protein L6R41_000601 [Letrouitia leprolyta]